MARLVIISSDLPPVSFLGRESKTKPADKKHTTAGIRWWLPTQLLTCRSEAFTCFLLRKVPSGLAGERRRPQDIEALTMLLLAKVVTP
jgi:hypothetical protein